MRSNPLTSGVRPQPMHRVAAVALLAAVSAVARAGDVCSDAYLDATRIASAQECRKGAESGNTESQFGYGLILWSGHGRPAQQKEALDWFRRAARQGHPLAQVMLGRMLSDPEVPAELRNPIEGYAWWVVAGERDAARALRSRLSVAEVAQAEQLAREFEAAYGLPR